MKRRLLVMAVLVLGCVGALKLTAQEPPPIPDGQCCYDPQMQTCNFNESICPEGQVPMKCPCIVQ